MSLALIRHTLGQCATIISTLVYVKLVTIHFGACNFAIVYLYKEIKIKPTNYMNLFAKA